MKRCGYSSPIKYKLCQEIVAEIQKYIEQYLSKKENKCKVEKK